jgi:hypothetical protein
MQNLCDSRIVRWKHRAQAVIQTGRLIFNGRQNKKERKGGKKERETDRYDAKYFLYILTLQSLIR